MIVTVKNIRDLALKKKNELMTKGEDLKKINNIITFLQDDMCFFKTDIYTSIPILLYLGVGEDEVKDVYFELMSIDNYKKGPDIRTIIER